jgi:4-amino-4-deoxy-L-arabinose transferase-like glycosyltransferase
MNNKKLLFAILFLATILRLCFLSRGDVVSDEASYAFRGIGMMDFDEASLQTTPWEWTDPNIPFWAKLSFHDDPPIVFLVQHFSMGIFGTNNFGIRFPSAILGILSVWLVYLIGRRLFSEKAGLFSSLFYAVTLNGGYIARLGLMESYVIFFMLLAVYVFLEALKNDKYLLGLGVVLGLAFLTKYTAFVLPIIFFIYLVLHRRDLFNNKKLWIGVGIAVLIFSPVIFYNFKLYQLKGHFDFQFSYLFKQHVAEWQASPGKEIGSLTERIKVLPLRFLSSNSWIFLLLFLLSTGFYCKQWKKMNTLTRPVLPITLTILLVFIVFSIGPSYRFLSIMGPFLALGIGFLIDHFYESYSNYRKFIYIFLAGIVIFEIFYFCNNLIAYYPIGPRYWLSSPIRSESSNLGYNELDDFLNVELKGRAPALTFESRYDFLEQAKKQGIEKASQENKSFYPALIIYGGQWSGMAKLWVLEKRHIYEGWPIVSVQDYFSYLQKNGFDYFDRSGFSVRYFIWPAKDVAGDIEKSLMQGEREMIYNKRGEEVFEIYKF